MEFLSCSTAREALCCVKGPHPWNPWHVLEHRSSVNGSSCPGGQRYIRVAPSRLTRSQTCRWARIVGLDRPSRCSRVSGVSGVVVPIVVFDVTGCKSGQNGVLACYGPFGPATTEFLTRGALRSGKEDRSENRLHSSAGFLYCCLSSSRLSCPQPTLGLCLAKRHLQQGPGADCTS